jgi:hypothetical protein
MGHRQRTECPLGAQVIDLCSMEREDLRAGIARLSKLPRCAARHPELRRQRGTSRAGYGLRKLICVIQQCRRGPSLALGMTVVLHLGTRTAE